MSDITVQEQAWSGDFGKEYTQRLTVGDMELDRQYEQRIGVKRSDIDREFLDGESLFTISALSGVWPNGAWECLEVGCNVGNRLFALNRLWGGGKFAGIDICGEAISRARERAACNFDFRAGSAKKLPFWSGKFSLVMTNGLLIHISPDDIIDVMSEVYRCSGKYIFGFEYFSSVYENVVYRGHKNLLWKGDFAGMYLDNFPGLKIVKEKIYRHVDNKHLFDHAFLLEKIV